MLFVAERLLLRDIRPDHLRAQPSLADEAEEHFILLMGSGDLDEIRASIASDGPCKMFSSESRATRRHR